MPWARRGGVWLAAVTLLRWLAGFRPGSRVTFFQQSQKKVTKKKASHVRAASRCLALLAAFGTLANSLRSNSASVLIRTLLRCSARPNGGGYLTARPLRELRPNGSFAALTSRGFALPHSSSLTSRKGTARRATTPDTPSFLTPHFSSWATTRVAPTTSPLTPTTSLLRPHSSSLLTPHSYDLTPHPSLAQVFDQNSVEFKHVDLWFAE